MQEMGTAAKWLGTWWLADIRSGPLALESLRDVAEGLERDDF